MPPKVSSSSISPASEAEAGAVHLACVKTHRNHRARDQRYLHPQTAPAPVVPAPRLAAVAPGQLGSPSRRGNSRGYRGPDLIGRRRKSMTR